MSKKTTAAKRLLHWIRGYLCTCIVIYLICSSAGAFVHMSLSIYNPYEWESVSRAFIAFAWTLIFIWGVSNYDDLTRDIK